MKHITLQEAYNILEEASAIIVDDDALIYPSLADLEDELDNEFLYLSWDSEGLGFAIKFKEENNQHPKVSGDRLLLNDTEGEEISLTILMPKTLE